MFSLDDALFGLLAAGSTMAIVLAVTQFWRNRFCLPVWFDGLELYLGHPTFAFPRRVNGQFLTTIRGMTLFILQVLTGTGTGFLENREIQ